MKNKIREIEPLRKIARNIAKKLLNCEESAVWKRIDELSLQQKENLFTVDQLMAQIQELQDKVNSLNDA